MTYDIYTFGNGEILEGVFQAIAMALNGHTGTLFEPLKRMGMLLGVFWAAVYALYGDQARVFTHWIVPSAVIMNLLFVPEATVWIHDPVTKYDQKVEHIPYGLAAFAGYISKIGFAVTGEIERIFSLPDDLRYQKSGTLFASNLIQQAKTFHITHADLADNMRGFVGQCVIYDAMLGRKYTIEDLRHSDDLWALVSEHASPVRSFMWREPKAEEEAERAPPEIITCQEGVTRFNRLWGGELNRAATLYGKKIFGNNALIPAGPELLKYLPLAYSQLGDIAKGATDILRQQMMMYALVDGVESASTAVGNAPNFAARRAYLQQRATYETLGHMAGETLPTMKAVLEAIAYGCFIFVIPLALLPFGYRFLLSWAQVLLWLQMWAPLYSILNFIMTLAARSKTLAHLSISNEVGVTLATNVGIANVNADMAAMAGYLAMSIPFLCIALVKGVGSFVGLASHLGGVSQSAAGTAASEVTSGNLSYGNIHEGNVQMGNLSMLSHSHGARYQARSMHMHDGRSEITTLADGSQVMNIGTSNLPISVNAASNLSAQQSQMATKAYQRGLNFSESSSASLSSATRSLVSLSESLSHMESQGDGVSQGVNTEQSQAIHKGASLIRDFATQNQIGTDKAAKILASASFGSSKNGGGLLRGSIAMDGSLSANDQELYTKAEKYVNDTAFQQAVREAAHSSQQLSHNLSDEQSRRLADEVSGSYEQGMAERREAAKSFNTSSNYSSQAAMTAANSASINANYNQQFAEWLADQPADNVQGRMGQREAAYIISHKPQLAQAYAQRFMEEKGLIPSSQIGMSPTSLRDDYEQDTGHQVYAVTRSDMDAVRSKGADLKSHTPKGDTLRQDVLMAQERDKMQISLSSTFHVTEPGEATKRAIDAQKQKGVVRRVGEKGIGEARGVAKDIKQILDGEPQQK
jgi:conjugal transfer mating pair stabilization protein TraG